jgi:3-hydroxyisobutyrate dehydrogenase-like beta-hydroxyacid dehydrogenase
MGHGIGKNIVTKGYGLNVMAHRNRAPVASLLAMGALECKTPAEIAANSDLVILCVTGSPQVEESLLGKNGVLQGAREGLIVADCSTAEPDSTVKLAAILQAKGVRLVDTPLTRTPKEAEAGKLGMMTGGDEALLNQIRPVLSCFADTIIHAGPIGAGHRLKLINNFLSLSHAAIAAEAIAVAAKAGVSMQALKDIVVAGGANSVMFERIIKVPLEDDDSAAKFAIRNARKDLRYYTAMAEEQASASFLAEQVLQLYTIAENLGFADRYVPRMVDVMMQIGTGSKPQG